MNKDTYWFSHDYNAKDDPKCVMLIDQLGMEGYGIYWVLLEVLRGQPDLCYPMALVPALAKRYGTTAQKVEAVINGFGLFEIQGDKFFYSNSLITRVLAYKEKQDRKSAAALKANQIRWNNEPPKQIPIASDLTPNGVQTESERNPNGIRTESERNPNLSQIKEIKRNNITTSSSLHSEDSLISENSVPVSDSVQPEEREVLSNKHCQQVVDFWNKKVAETQATYSEVKMVTDKRKAKIRVRWKEFAKVGNPVEVCRTIFDKACASKFMQGDNPRGWTASFDWIFDSEKHWVNVYEGNYDEKGKAQQPTLDDLYREQIKRMRNDYGTDTTDSPDIQG